MPRLLVGTSGYSYAHWRDVLYEGVPQRLWLEAYAARFPAVELNVTFYRLPPAETFRGWRERTPEGFRFSIKGSRLITHYHRLNDVDQAVYELFGRARELGDKLEVVLWQLPPKMPADALRLEAFCGLLGRVAPRVRHAFEFRDARWFAEPVYDVLRAHGHALCVADAPWRKPVDRVTARFTYLRFHAGTERADGGYSEDELERWATTVRQRLEQGVDVYAFFNNDALGWAVRNALRLEELAEAAPPPPKTAAPEPRRAAGGRAASRASR